MEKIDFKKEMADIYNPSKKQFSIVKIPAMQYFMIDGSGNPNNSTIFQSSLQALYSLSFTIKFNLKKSEKALDYTVMPLEGLWWSDFGEADFITGNKDNFLWTLMIMQPDFVTADDVEKAFEDVRKKGKVEKLDMVRFESIPENMAAHIMYIGPFDDEYPTVQAMHRFIDEQGYKIVGKHREIYLSDFRRTKPENLRTIIRQTVEKK